jgi:alpha-amylase
MYRYQPVSYKINSRSGNESEFLDMTTRCNKVGVRIYADVVFNHMTAISSDGVEIGTAGSISNATTKSYPAVPYRAEHFHSENCEITNYNDPVNVRNCKLVGLNDLNQTSSYVVDRIVEYLNHLIDLGVAGFRIDAAKHMDPKDLKIILGKLKYLNIFQNFDAYTKPFIYLEVIGNGGAITVDEYTGLGVVTEFKYSMEIGKAFKGLNALKWLRNFGPAWGFLPSQLAMTFIDNHDNQRSGELI